MGLSRLTSEPNVYRNNEQTMFVMVYVDDLLFLEQQQEVDKTFIKYKSMYYYDQPAHWELVRQSNSLAETSTTMETSLR